MTPKGRREKDEDEREVRLDLDLAPDLLLDLVLDNLFLVEALEGDDVLWLGLGASHVDTAKLALAEGLANLERRQREGDRRPVAARVGQSVSDLVVKTRQGCSTRRADPRAPPAHKQNDKTHLPAALESRASSFAASPLTTP